MRPSGRRAPVLYLALLSLAAGCAGPEERAELKECLGPGCQQRAVADPSVTGSYPLACPDELVVRVEGRPDLSGPAIVRADGRIRLGEVAEVRVEGETPRMLEWNIARWAGVPPSQVRVQVTGHHSRRIYLFGPVSGVPRAVDYRGPERVVDMLQRSGGLRTGAKLNEVHVVRPNVAAGAAPAVYPVDVEAIVLANDDRTNIPLQPFDQVYVGETRRSLLLKIFPPWLQPAFKALCALCPSPNGMRRRP